MTVPEDENVDIGKLRRAAVFAALRGPRLMDDPEPDASDLRMGDLREALPEHTMVVVPEHTDQATASILQAVQQ